MSGWPHVIEVRNLTVTFDTPVGPANAIDGVSFAIGAGKILCLVGESGSGKSVTGFSLIGLVEPGRVASGEILFEGQNLTALPEKEVSRLRGRAISLIFQEPMTALNPMKRVGDQIAEVLTIYGQSGRAAWNQAVVLLERVGIRNAAVRARAYPHELSGGMRQRVMIAIACIGRPRLIIADEPTTALDVTVQAQVLDLLLDIQSELGSAILFITHDLAVVAEIADDVAVMYAGQIIEAGSAEQIFERPAHPYTAALIAAIPDIDSPQDETKPMVAIPGSASGLLDRGTGCRFRGRCPKAHDRCLEEPPVVAISDGHSTTCWLHVP